MKLIRRIERTKYSLQDESVNGLGERHLGLTFELLLKMVPERRKNLKIAAINCTLTVCANKCNILQQLF